MQRPPALRARCAPAAARPLQLQEMRVPCPIARAGAGRAGLRDTTGALLERERRARRGRRAGGAPTVAARVASVSGGPGGGTSDEPPPPAGADGVVPPSEPPSTSASAAAAAGAGAAAAVPPPAQPAAAAAAAAAAPGAAFSQALDALTRARWYSWYLERLEKQPTITKACTAAVGFVIGDLIAQSLSTGHHPGDAAAGAAAVVGAAAASSFPAWLAALAAHVDWARTARMGAFGLLFDGPVGGAYYAWLDRTIWPDDPLSARTVITKTVIDQTVYSSFGTVAFFTFIRLLETGGDFSAVGPTIAAKFWPTLIGAAKFWPIAHLINFRFVPPPLRVAYNQVAAIGWLTWLSLLAHSRQASGPAVAALAHKAGSAASSAAAGGGLGAWLHSLLGALPHF